MLRQWHQGVSRLVWKRPRIRGTLPAIAATPAAWLFVAAVPCRADVITYYRTERGVINPDRGKPVNAAATFSASGTTLSCLLFSRMYSR